jgi:hypothetical protein
MATSYYNISLHHLANHLIHLSSSSSFWFSLNSNYDNEFHLSKRLSTSRPAGCFIASLHPLVVPLHCPLFALACCHITSPCPLVAPYSLPIIASAGCCIAWWRPPSHCCTVATADAAAAAPPAICCQRRAVALPPPPLTLPLPPPPCRRQAAANVALLRCRHRRSLRAAATALPPLRYAL